MDDDLFGGIFGFILIVIVFIGILYLISLVASAVLAVAGIGGLAWGGGTAVVNYAKSVKENMIDSNRK